MTAPLIEEHLKKVSGNTMSHLHHHAQVLRCHCPATGSIGGLKAADWEAAGLPCLLSCAEAGGKRKTGFTVEAISATHGCSWIGVNQGRANKRALGLHLNLKQC